MLETIMQSRPSPNLMRLNLRRSTPAMKNIIAQLKEKGGSAIMWIEYGQARSINILRRRQIITVIHGRKDGPVSLSLTPEARLALGMQEREAA